jgi:hypothetical protein
MRAPPTPFLFTIRCTARRWISTKPYLVLVKFLVVVCLLPIAYALNVTLAAPGWSKLESLAHVRTNR